MTPIVQAEVPCPFCGEVFTISIDTMQGDCSTIEDCQVCCRPIQLTIACEPGEVLGVDVAQG